MINSWIIYLRLSLCHYVNKMIIGSSYGFVHGFASLYAVDVIFFSFPLTVLLVISSFIVLNYMLLSLSAYTGHRTIGQRIESSVRFSLVRFLCVYHYFHFQIGILLFALLKNKWKTKSCFFWSSSVKGFIVMSDCFHSAIRFDEMCWKNQQYQMDCIFHRLSIA